MEIEKFQTPAALVMRPGGDRIDAYAAVSFKETVCQTAQNHDGDIALWLDQIEFIDSSGLGSIVGVLKRLRNGQKLYLVSLQPAVEKVFELTHMHKIFNIFKDLEHMDHEKSQVRT